MIYVNLIVGGNGTSRSSVVTKLIEAGNNNDNTTFEELLRTPQIISLLNQPNSPVNYSSFKRGWAYNRFDRMCREGRCPALLSCFKENPQNVTLENVTKALQGDPYFAHAHLSTGLYRLLEFPPACYKIWYDYHREVFICHDSIGWGYNCFNEGTLWKNVQKIIKHTRLRHPFVGIEYKENLPHNDRVVPLLILYGYLQNSCYYFSNKNFFDDHHISFAHWAAAVGNEKNSFGNANAVDDYGYKPIDYAVRNGHYELAQKLSHNAKGYHKILPLQSAIHYKDDRYVEQFLQLPYIETDVKRKDYKGNTPLHEAAQRRNLSFFDKLVKLGANLYTLNDKHQSPLEVRLRNKTIWPEEWLDSYKKVCSLWLKTVFNFDSEVGEKVAFCLFFISKHSPSPNTVNQYYRENFRVRQELLKLLQTLKLVQRAGHDYLTVGSDKKAPAENIINPS